MPWILMIMSYLRDLGIRFEQPSDTLVRTTFSGKNVLCDTLIVVDEGKRHIFIGSLCPALVPTRRLDAAKALLLLLNCLLNAGHLELERKLLILKTGVRVRTTGLGRETFHHLLFAHLLTMDMLFPAVAAVLSGAMTPEKAVAKLKDGRQAEHDDAARGEDRNPNRPDFNDRIRRFTDFSNN